VEHIPPPSGPGTVILDIGGSIGALVIDTSPGLEDREIEIRPRGEAWEGKHVAVRLRQLPDQVQYAAVFDSLHEGEYELRIRHGGENTPVTAVEVSGGKVTRSHLVEQ